MPDSQYNVNITISSKDQSSASTKKAASAMDYLKTAAAAAAVAYGALRTAQKAVDFARAGAEVMRQEAALNNLAVAAGTTAEAIVGSIQTASQFTIDRMTAMSVANRALVMEVAQTPAEFEKLTTTAITLGRAMGMTATTSIDRFVMAIGRQSRLVADDFGLLVSTERAYKNFAEANNVAADSLTLAQQKLAFFNEMMDQAGPKVATLGGVTRDAAADFEVLGAAFADAKSGLQEIAAVAATSIGPIEGLAQVIRGVPDAIQAVVDIGNIFVKMQEAQQGELSAGTEAWVLFDAAVIKAGAAVTAIENAWRGETQATTEATPVIATATVVTDGLAKAVGRLSAAMNQASTNAASLNRSLQEMANQIPVLSNQIGSTNSELQRMEDGLSGVGGAAAVDVVDLDALNAELERLWAETSNATIASEALSAQLMDATGAQVATIMINMLNESLLAGKMSQEAYATAVQGLQLQFGLATPETIKLAKAMNMLNTALAGGEIDPDQLASELANLDALKAQQAQVLANANAAKAGAAAKRDSTQATRDHEAAIRAEQRALEAEERAARRSAEALMTRSQRLKEGRKETAAQLLIDDLATQMNAGTISIDKYNRAVSQLMLGFGLATPESMQLATGLEVLLDAFTSGDIMSRELVAALNKLVGSTTGATTNNYNINDPTAGAIFSDQARASYAQSAGGG